MSETVFKSILEESARLEWAKYGSVPEHTFSAKHCRAMKRIFKAYERQTAFLSDDTICKGSAVSHFRWNRRTVAAMVILIFMAVLAGCAVVYFMSQGFRGEVYSDSTELFVIDTDNCPSSIEEKYYLSEVPEGFELSKTDSTPFYQYISYNNESTRQTLSLSQSVKSEFSSSHYNTEGRDFVEIEIDGRHGLCLEFSADGRVHSCIIWDNGDYVLELSGDLPKNELIVLAKSAKVLEN